MRGVVFNASLYHVIGRIAGCLIRMEAVAFYVDVFEQLLVEVR